ncbi:MAG: dienelactone hydrolase family protein [Gemmatimonadetes bacterium]|nr:dienelactone hydrolase family protein [Gemmatimonadota bacterium]
MRHPFLEQISERLCQREVATFRYQFPYLQAGGGRPDPPPVLHATVRAAVEAAAAALPSIPMLAGGKSLGGRMTSQAAAKQPLAGVHGVVFLGFPLHPPKEPSITRAEHLGQVSVPLLFLQGTRDTLADLALTKSVCVRLGSNAELHVVEGADHSFKVLKRSGRTETDVLDELAATILRWADALVGAGAGAGAVRR